MAALPVNSELTTIRHWLHRHPELSNREHNTAAFVVNFFNSLGGFRIIENLGGTGVLAVAKNHDGPVVYFRCELDALPIREENSNPHRSASEDVSHMCGHDGHMTILLGLARELQAQPPNFTVGFLFQPAEEIGCGAAQIMADSRWPELKPDIMLALHNLPGFPLHQIISRPGIFSSASVGLKIFLKGKTSHAAHPEEALNPLYAAQKIFKAVTTAPCRLQIPTALATPIALLSGSETFGTSPPDATLLFTLRAESNEALNQLKRDCRQQVNTIAEEEKIAVDLEYREEFAATENSPALVSALHKAAEACYLALREQEAAFRWSEDFGRFGRDCEILMFGLGSGLHHPQLHNPDYDFPDALIPTGIKLFRQLLNTISDAGK